MIHGTAFHGNSFVVLGKGKSHEKYCGFSDKFHLTGTYFENAWKL